MPSAGVRVGVVGHVEWVTFMEVDRPPTPGAILHAERTWDEPAGGGGVAAAELARLAGACTLFTGLGTDAVGQGIPAGLAALGVEVCGSSCPGPHRRAWTLLDPNGERTIVVAGEAQAVSGDDVVGAFEGFDAVYFCKGDAAALRAARAARVLVATARVLPVIEESGVRLDALVLSSNDPSEAYAHGDLTTEPALVARTDGANGGAWRNRAADTGRWRAAPARESGRPTDAYGCGDRFAAGLAFALATLRSDSIDGSDRDRIERCLSIAAESGSYALTRRGAHGVLDDR